MVCSPGRWETLEHGVGASLEWSSVFAVPWLFTASDYPGCLPILKFCPYYSMVRQTAAAPGPRVHVALSIQESLIMGREWMNFGNQKASLPPELVTWEPRRENSIPFQNVSFSPGLAPECHLTESPPQGPFCWSATLGWGMPVLEQWTAERSL